MPEFEIKICGTYSKHVLRYEYYKLWTEFIYENYRTDERNQVYD